MAEKKAVQARVRSVLEDPSALAIVRVYADAFLDAAKSAGVDASLEEFNSFVDDVLGTYPRFDRLLCSGLLNRDEKLAIIDRVIAPRGSEFFTTFLRVLARARPARSVAADSGRVKLIHETRSGKTPRAGAYRRRLTSVNLDKIHRRLKEFLPFEPILEAHRDASLIGGLVIQSGRHGLR